MEQSELSGFATVLVDIYPWLLAIDEQRRYVMEGVFRHGEMMGRIFQPAFFLQPHEKPPSAFAQQLLATQLGKPILRFKSVGEIEESGAKVWLSLAVDWCAPFLPSPSKNFVRAAILHDTLAADGYFGEEKRERFLMGARHNDVFLFVSTTSLHEFYKLLRIQAKGRVPRFIPYGCFHTLDRLPDIADSERHASSALAVHSLYKRKNVEDEILLACAMGFHLDVVGHNYDYVGSDLAVLEAGSTTNVAFHGAVHEPILRGHYESASVFVCLSKAEGFSMPAMEAILYGVPTVVLSDIHPHREIYGELGVNFVPVPLSFENKVKYFPEKQVTEADRQYLFETFGWGKVIAPFVAYLASEI